MTIKKIMDLGAKLLYPPRCPVCDNVVPIWEEGICKECLNKVRYVVPPFCLKCGKHLENSDEEYCEDCKGRSHAFVAGRALYEYKSVAKAIYRFKYGARCEYSEVFGEEMAYYLGQFLRDRKVEALLPVPMYRKKEKRRGYNQSALLARVIGKHAKIPVYEDFIVRIRDTRPQKLLNPEERLNNLKKAFILKENGVKLKVVVIIDDIYTTGSTIDEMAKVLISGGVQQVYFLTLAIGETI